MQGFKKLALVTAIAAAPAASFAMQPMSDSQLSGITGQQGITIAINTPSLTLDQVIFDRDGTANGGLGNDSGAIFIDNMVIDTGGDPITVDVDADGNGSAPVLNVQVGLPSNLTINTGDLYVADDTSTAANQANGVGTAWQIDTASQAQVLSSSQIAINGATLNIQLGNEVQGSMIALGGTITGGLAISDTELTDAGGAISGGSIYIGTTTITNAGGANLDLGVDIDVNANGLAISFNNNMGANGAIDIYQDHVEIGDQTASNNAIGDIAILGLDLSSTTITISGH